MAHLATSFPGLFESKKQTDLNLCVSLAAAYLVVKQTFVFSFVGNKNFLFEFRAGKNTVGKKKKLGR